MLINATKKAKKMHARRNPNLAISSAAYSQLSPSVTSASFLSPTVASRRGLLSQSPPVSPSLPSLIPRHGKKPSNSSYPRLLTRLLIGLGGIVIIGWIILRQIYTHHPQTAAATYEGDGEEWEMVGGNNLPKEPCAVAISDPNGKPKWTVSIPANYDFPLKPAQYRDICHQSMELSKQLRQEAHDASSIAKRMLNYYQKDQYYIDVQEAETQGLLPVSKIPQAKPKGFVVDLSPILGMPTCERTLTFVMETGDAGFGNTLLRLWMSFGLAMKENRTFFIDDTRWPYGQYSSYFAPPPSANCMPPPPSHMVPCPHNARHIVVSAITVKQTFGHTFTEEWEDATKMRVDRQRKIFDLIRVGYESLFQLKREDAKYVTERARSIYGPVKEDGGISIGIHVRRGDKHPYEYQYSKDYIPLDRYMDTARDIYIDKVENTGGKSKKKRSLSEEHTLFARHTSSKLVLASDDPVVYESHELGPNTIRAQERIILATKATLEAAQGKKNPWIDEITGWEGGFYRDVFFSLGRPVGNANDVNQLENTNVPEGAMGIRELVGRAYLLDLAVLSKADLMICTVSSIGCRLLAVMMGWDSAIVKGNWKNVDGDFDWKGIMW